MLREKITGLIKSLPKKKHPQVVFLIPGVRHRTAGASAGWPGAAAGDAGRVRQQKTKLITTKDDFDPVRPHHIASSTSASSTTPSKNWQWPRSGSAESATGTSGAAHLPRQRAVDRTRRATKWDFGDLPQKKNQLQQRPPAAHRLPGAGRQRRLGGDPPVRHRTRSPKRCARRARLLRLELKRADETTGKSLPGFTNWQCSYAPWPTPTTRKTTSSPPSTDRAFIGDEELPHSEKPSPTWKQKAKTRRRR